MRWLLFRFFYFKSLAHVTKTAEEFIMQDNNRHHATFEACDRCGEDVRASWCLHRGEQHLHFCHHHYTSMREMGERSGFSWFPITAEALQTQLAPKTAA